MTEIARKIDELERDPESAHARADEWLLAALRVAGAPEVAEAYQRLVRECAWWAFA